MIIILAIACHLRATELRTEARSLDEQVKDLQADQRRIREQIRELNRARGYDSVVTLGLIERHPDFPLAA